MSSELAISQRTTFQASWPDALNPDLQSLCTKVMQVAWLILSIVIFPIGLARLVAYGLRLLASAIILPGPRMGFTEEEIVKNEARLLRFPHERVAIKTPDGVELDGILFTSPRTEKGKTLVYGMGNGQAWETIDEWQLARLLGLGVNVLAVNPRGIEKSTGYKDLSKLQLDVYAASDFLIKEKKVDPDDMVYDAFSLSGGYMMEGAALVQEQYPEKKIKAISKCSYATLSQVVEDRIPKILGSCCTCCAGFLTWLAGFLIRVCGAEVDSKTAWDKLKGRKCVVYSEEDRAIPYGPSLHRAIALDNRAQVTEIQLYCHQEERWAPHGYMADCAKIALCEEIISLLNLNTEIIRTMHPNCLCKRDMRIIAA